MIKAGYFDRKVGLDDGEWLRPLITRSSKKTRRQPETKVIERVRAEVLRQIEQESVSLVA